MKNITFNRIVLGVVATSLIINVVLFVALLEIRNNITTAATQAASILQQAKTQSLAAPLTANVAINEVFNVPIKTVVPINTTVQVPVVIPIIGQKVTIAVPINTNIPIDMTVPVHIKTTIPVDVKISSSPFYGILQQFQDWLSGLVKHL